MRVGSGVGVAWLLGGRGRRQRAGACVLGGGEAVQLLEAAGATACGGVHERGLEGGPRLRGVAAAAWCVAEGWAGGGRRMKR
jgi:hypothetical protein